VTNKDQRCFFRRNFLLPVTAGVLMLVAAKGSWISVRCQGPDSGKAMEALAALVKDKFGED